MLLLLSFEISFYVLVGSPLSDKWFAKFFPSLGLVFLSSSRVSFSEQVLNFDKVQFINFSFYG